MNKSMSITSTSFGAGFNVDRNAVPPGASRAVQGLLGRTITITDPAGNIIIESGLVTTITPSPSNPKTSLITLTKTVDGTDAGGPGQKFRISGH
jgi:hypothetical protein